MNASDVDKILQENGLTETELIFKTNVKKLRLQSKEQLTISETAQALGIKYGKYRLIESYTPINVKFETMERIAKYYQVEVKDLFSI